MFIILILQALVFVQASEHSYFVKPDNFSSNCSSQDYLCLTLDNYASNQSEFFTSNSTFLFLPGTHTTRTVVLLVNISDVRFIGFEFSETDFTVECTNVSDITVQGLLLRLTSGESNTTMTFINSSNILVMHATFQGSMQHQTRAILLEHSIATFRNCTFKENMGVSSGGGILVRERSKALVWNSTFIKNTAIKGGAVFVNQSEFWVSESVFVNNSAEKAGGIYASQSLLEGGAAFVIQSEFWVSESFFINNSASDGGGIYALKSLFIISSTDFISNSAMIRGAAAVFENAEGKFSNITVIGNLVVALAFYRSKANFTGTTIFKENIDTVTTRGVGGALFAEASTLSFLGNTLFQDNYAYREGGAIAGLVQTTIIFAGNTKFTNNIAYLAGGGAVLLGIDSRLEMHGSVLFENNNCTTCYGGAISVTDASEVEIFDSVTFKNNSGQMGGAIYVRASTMVLNPGVRLESIDNYAEYLGGGIFHYDNINYQQCNFANYPQRKWRLKLLSLPKCFLRFRNFSLANTPQYQILSINDTAGVDGEFMYGGLMDKCRIVDIHEKIEDELLYNIVFEHKILQIQSFIESENLHTISSEAFTLCFCETTEVFDCTRSAQISTYRGSRFNVSVLALSQGNAITAPVILAKVSKTARLKLNQYSKQITANCSTLSYNMYSTQENERLTIYPDESCRDTGLAAAVINVTFLPCPTGTVQSGDECVCEPRLQKYTNECIFGDKENYQITRKSSDRFWIGFSNNRKYGKGLILCKSCPPDYCQTDDVNISLADLDVQCAFNHSGLLCGSCVQNHSRIFANSKCQNCSNMFILLLIAFTIAGILLVAFLSILRLTVATGMINSIILYANIVQANKVDFFPDTINVVTVFIAWMNLDLGIPTCFYNGMDAYAQTWLQFAFPLYVWFLITLIIITSRYSTLVTKLIGSNPIAVLATLLLMSYTKILKNIIEIYSSVEMEYPHVNVTVWFKDATVPYLQSRHLVLAVLSSIFIALFFLPYTIFLLSGYKMYRFSQKKLIRQLMMKLKPLLDSYYAPHEKHSRFWPGLLLLVRCALYIVFTSDYIHGSANSLLAISITFTILIVIAWLLSWLSVRIYTSFFVSTIEALVFLNLIVLTIVKLSGADSFELTFSLVGMVFAMMVGIIFYQFYLIYIAKSALWQKFIVFCTFYKEEGSNQREYGRKDSFDK